MAMQHLVESTLGRVSRRVAHALRRSDRPAAADVAMQAGLDRLASAGIDVRCAIDGGAFRGEWTEMLRRTFPQARCLMIEPQPRWQDELRRVVSTTGCRTDLLHAVLGACSRPEVDFIVLDDPHGGTGSSMLPENSSVPSHVERIPMVTLAQAMEQFELGVPDLIKLDVQGYEIEVLRGLGERIAEVPFVLLEVATWTYNQGAPLLDEVVAWMKSHRFVTHDLFGETRLPDGTLAQVDLLFARHDAAVRTPRTIEFN